MQPTANLDSWFPISQVLLLTCMIQHQNYRLTDIDIIKFPRLISILMDLCTQIAFLGLCELRAIEVSMSHVLTVTLKNRQVLGPILPQT
jgi:hypothetical protein